MPVAGGWGLPEGAREDRPDKADSSSFQDHEGLLKPMRASIEHAFGSGKRWGRPLADGRPSRRLPNRTGVRIVWGMDLALAAAAVAPTTLAVDRTIPVGAAWTSLLPDGLVRGRSIACTGLAAPSLALSLLGGALGGGAWLAVVDVPWLGIEAAADLGIPIERLVRVDTAGPSGERSGELWAEVTAAAIDGFDGILTRIPPRTPAGLARRLQTRLRRRGGILITLGDPGTLTADLTITADDVRWDGLGSGHGHLRRRRLNTVVTGRRAPRGRRTALHLPAPDGGTAPATPAVTAAAPSVTCPAPSTAAPAGITRPPRRPRPSPRSRRPSRHDPAGPLPDAG